MSKSMYSLILVDEIVRAVDKLAHQRGTNRSNLINQILAEHLSLKTPEKRIGEIFLHAQDNLDGDALQVLQQSSGMLVVKGAVNFKYNPTIRYCIELESAPRAYLGELKVSTRTQSKALVTRLNMFYELWMQIEQSCPTPLRRGKPKFEMGDGRFKREIIAEHRGEGIDPAVLGKAIAEFLHLFDKAMGMFFETRSGMDIGTYKEMVAIYERYLENSELAF